MGENGINPCQQWNPRRNFAKAKGDNLTVLVDLEARRVEVDTHGTPSNRRET